jgi:hypothetical protein
LEEDGQELPPEGMMFVGDKGKILAGFRVENPRLIPQARMKGMEAPPAPVRPRNEGPEPPPLSPGLTQWVAACRGDKQHSPGSFLRAGAISEAVDLYAVALRTGKRLLYDSGTCEITNVPQANQYLSRGYRAGWDLLTI